MDAITLALAIYTALLWGATKSLAAEAKATAERQADDVQTSLALSRESADIATQAAKAATMHATAAVAVERPFVRVRTVALNMVPAQGDAKSFTLGFEFQNYGRTPAFVTRIGYGFQVAYHPTAAEPEYMFASIAQEFVIEPHAKRWLDAPGLVVITPAEWSAVTERTNFLWCWGQLQYGDFINGVAETGFCARYYPEVGTGVRIEEEAEFRFTGPDAYTYQRYTEGENR